MDDEDAQQALRRLVLEAEKRTKGFLPPPAHLAAVGHHSSSGAKTVAAAASSSLSGSSTTAFAPTVASGRVGAAAVPVPAVNAAAARQAAELACRRRVAAVGPWFDRLHGAMVNADAAEERVEGVQCRIETLADITQRVRQHSNALSSNAGALMGRKAQLERTLSEVTTALRNFTRVDELLAEVAKPTTSVTDPAFPGLLDSLEDTAGYLARVHTFKSAAAYASRLSLAYQRAMMLLRDAITTRVQDAAAEISASTAYRALFRDPSLVPFSAAAGSGVATVSSSLMPKPPKTLGAALRTLNRAYLQQLEPIAPQLRLLEARGDAPEAAPFVADVFAACTEARSKLVGPLLADYAGGNGSSSNSSTAQGPKPPPRAEEEDVVARLLETLCIALLQERKLFDRVWLSDRITAAGAGFRGVGTEIADAVYQHFRRWLLRTDELSELALLCEALLRFKGAIERHETPELVAAVLPQLDGSRSGDAAHEKPDDEKQKEDQEEDEEEASGGASSSDPTDFHAHLTFTLPTVVRMLQDTQERIVFRTSLFLRHRVAPFPYRGDALWKQCMEAVESASSAAAAATASTAAMQDEAATLSAEFPTQAVLNTPEGAEGASVSLSPGEQKEEEDTAHVVAAPTSRHHTTPSGSSASVSVPATPLSPKTAQNFDVFVPLSQCIWLLNLLYPAVERGVFAVFADEAVHVAVQQLERGAKAVRQSGELAMAALDTGAQDSAGSALARSLPQLYAHLFLVHHLLQLREVLNRYDVNLLVTEKGVNLSSLAERKIELLQTQRESKRDVEAVLRGACEGAIALMSTLASGPLAKRPLPPASDAAGLLDHVTNAVKEASKVAEALRRDLSAFVPTNSTRAVLWRPVQMRARAAYDALEEAAQHVIPEFVASDEALQLVEGF